uniref:Skp1-related protein n=1 Tax=Romanomermis culicivorax TaxID=13658 RepID=A0A915JKM8_ROMCU
LGTRSESEEDKKPIQLQNIDGPTLETVIGWCEEHKNLPINHSDDEVNEKPREEDDDFVEGDYSPMNKLSKWEINFFRGMAIEMKCGIIKAANFLNIKDLLDHACIFLADSMRGLPPDEIRSLFHIKNDLSPAEIRKIKRENEWYHADDVVSQEVAK